MKEMLRENDLTVLMKHADEGDLDAMHHFITLCAIKDDKDWHILSEGRCIEYMKKLAAAGRPEAYAQLAQMFLNGKGVKKNVDMAMELYQKAVDSGEETANGFMGLVYYEGKDLPQDYKKVYELFMKAGSKFNEVFYTLGEMYRLGQYVEPDMEKANEYYQKVVDMGEFMPGTGLDWIFHCAEERLKGNYEDLVAPDF